MLVHAEKDGEPAEAFPLGEISCYSSVFRVLLLVALVANIVSCAPSLTSLLWLFLIYEGLCQGGFIKWKLSLNLKDLVVAHLRICVCSPGDCDYDDDCQGDLVCFYRDYYEDVPGCTGGEEDRDYCVDPFLAPLREGSPSDNFQLKMYWQEGYTWQEVRSLNFVARIPRKIRFLTHFLQTLMPFRRSIGNV